MQGAGTHTHGQGAGSGAAAGAVLPRGPPQSYRIVPRAHEQGLPLPGDTANSVLMVLLTMALTQRARHPEQQAG